MRSLHGGLEDNQDFPSALDGVSGGDCGGLSAASCPFWPASEGLRATAAANECGASDLPMVRGEGSTRRGPRWAGRN